MEVDNVNVEFPRYLVRALIQQYRQLPSLWNRSHPHYRDKAKRHNALAKLTALVQDHDPSATRVHVLRKLESLRACMRREHKKVLKSKAKSTGRIYTPTLWYYDLFSFAFEDKQEAASEQPSSSEQAEEAVYLSEKEEGEEEESILSDDNVPYEEEAYPVIEYTEVVGNDQSSSKRFQYEDEQSRAVKRSCSQVDDEYDAIGINVAAKLRTLPANMRIIAEKLINDVLFQAQVNELSSNSAVITVDPFKPYKRYK